MSEQEFDNYSIEDDELDPELLPGPGNEDEEGDKPQEEKGEKTPESPKKRQAPILMLFRLMINPVEGWKELRRRNLTVDQAGTGMFYPLAGLAALSCFADIFYNPQFELQKTIVAALVVFVSLFLGNFVAIMAMKILLPKSCKEISERPFTKIMTMAMLSTLALFYTAYSLLPMLQPLLVFLPLWTIYLTVKGTRFLKPPKEKQTTVTGMVCISILGAPLLVAWLFSEILP